MRSLLIRTLLGCRLSPGDASRDVSKLGHHRCNSTLPVSEESTSAFAYCVQQVRKYERDNYTWITQLPPALRRPVIALRAFNIESVLIGDQVQSKEGPIMQIRFHWWRDAIDALFKGQGGAPKHPVVLAMGSSLFGQKQDGTVLPLVKKYNLKRILDTRESDLMDSQPPLSLEGLEAYAEGTASQVLYLQLSATGVANKDSDHAASHLGKAIGITTLLKGTAYHASNRRSYLPLDLCAEHSVSQEDVYRGVVTDGLQDVVLKVATRAKAHLDEARSFQAKIPESARHLMLPSLAVDGFLKALEAENFDPFAPALLRKGGPGSPLGHVLQVKWHLWSKTY